LRVIAQDLPGKLVRQIKLAVLAQIDFSECAARISALIPKRLGVGDAI
jgi:hypothetical protein